jgi:hypothetical protein
MDSSAGKLPLPGKEMIFPLIIRLNEYVIKSQTKMAKEIGALIKLQVKGGAANPAPPIGPALGAKGVNIMEFCKQFNARTQDQAGKSTSGYYHCLYR